MYLTWSYTYTCEHMYTKVRDSHLGSLTLHHGFESMFPTEPGAYWLTKLVDWGLEGSGNPLICALPRTGVTALHHHTWLLCGC